MKDAIIGTSLGLTLIAGLIIWNWADTQTWCSRCHLPINGVPYMSLLPVVELTHTWQEQSEWEIDGVKYCYGKRC